VPETVGTDELDGAVAAHADVDAGRLVFALVLPAASLAETASV
jgi:hypothetical protein